MKKKLACVLAAALVMAAAAPAVSGEAPATGWDDPNIFWRTDTDPVTFDCYIDYDWYAIDTWGKDDVSKVIQEKTGVSLNVTKSSDSSQLQVLLAADELPETVFTMNHVKRFSQPDVSYAYDELINQYCPEFMDLIDPIEVVNNTVDDGHFYALRSHYNNAQAWADLRNLPSDGSAGFYVRQDILDALGNPKLESLDDMMAVYAQVKEQYPNLAVYAPHPTWGVPFMEYMGMVFPGDKFVDEDGSVKLGYLQPELEEYLVFINRLIREGYVSAEAFTYQPEQFFQIVRSGQVFSASYNSLLADETNIIYDENGIDAHLTPVVKPLTWQGEERFAPLDGGVGWSNWFITKKCKDPERAIKFMEFLRSPEGDALTQWGIEGQHYTLTDDGLLQRPEGYEKLTQAQTGISCWYFGASGLAEGVAISSTKVSFPKYASRVDLLQERKQHIVRNPVISFTASEPDSDESVIEVKLQELYNNTWLQIAQAPTEEACRAGYAKLMEDCKTVGIDRLTEYYTAKYNAAESKYDGLQ